MPPAQQYPQNFNSHSSQKKGNYLIPFIISALLAITFIGLFIWAFMGMQDYKNNTDKKIDAAVKIEVQKESDRKDNEFIEKEKNPNKTFTGSDTFGGVTFSYPKTWSGYVLSNEKSSAPLDVYFHKDLVPDTSTKIAYALRVRVLDKQYSEHVKTFESKIKQGKFTAVAYSAKNQPKTIGVRYDGEVNVGQSVHMIILPLRDKTIEISTESDQFRDDFDKIILETLNFTP